MHPNTSKLNSPVNPLPPSPLQGPLKAAATITTPGRADKQLYFDTAVSSFLQETESVTSAKHPSSCLFLTSYPQAMLQTGQLVSHSLAWKIWNFPQPGNGAAQRKEQN